MSAACCSASVRRTAAGMCILMPMPMTTCAGSGRLAAHLDQNAAQLAPLPEQVVRPFQADALDAEATQRVHGRDADCETQSGKCRRRLEKLPPHRHADAAAERCHPAAAAPAAAGVLHFRDTQRGSCRASLRGVLGDVAVRGIDSEQYLERLESADASPGSDSALIAFVVQQVDRTRQPITLPRHGFDVDAQSLAASGSASRLRHARSADVCASCSPEWNAPFASIFSSRVRRVACAICCY